MPLLTPRLLSAVVGLILLLGSAAHHRQQAPDRRLQQALDALHGQADVPGVSAAVVLADGTVLPLTAGFADKEMKQPMSADVLLMQGSVGKTYVAVVALQLVSERKLALDDRVEKYLGDEEWFGRLPNGPDITVRMLMNHTSGLVRYEFQPAFTEELAKQPDKTWKPHELIAYILGSEPPFAAGQGWEYSDTNYIVLGMIIEKVTGQPYFTELRRRLLEPLELAQTVPVEGRRVEGLVQGYAGARNPFGGQDRMLSEEGEMIINPQFEWTGGGIASTPSDLARWAKLMYEGKAFDPKLLPAMLEGVEAPMLGAQAKYGLGVILRPTRLGPSYGHSGFFPGYMTEVVYWPEHKLAVAVQVNTSEFRKVRPPLVQWCTELAEAALAAEAGQRQGKAAPEPKRTTTDDVRVSIATAKTIYESGDRVNLLIHIRNAGVEPRTISYLWPVGLALGVTVQDIDGRDAPTLFKRQRMGDVKSRGVVLEPGQVITDTVCLSSLFDLTRPSSFYAELAVGSSVFKEFDLEEHLKSGKPLPDVPPLETSYSNRLEIKMTYPDYVEPKPRWEDPARAELAEAALAAEGASTRPAVRP